MKIVRDGSGNIVEVIFAEGEDQSLAWKGISEIERQRAISNSPLLKPMNFGGMGMGMVPMPPMPPIPPIPPMPGLGANSQKQYEENMKAYQEQMAAYERSTTEYLAQLNKRASEQEPKDPENSIF